MNRDIGERNRLVSENMGLVHACANRFRGRGVDYEDLVQSGCIGLLKAAEGFDETRGFMFSTYAVPAILGEIKRIFRDGGAVKVSRSDKEKARELMRVRDELINQFDREPSISELAEKSGFAIAEASQLLCASLPVLSLTVDDENGDCSQADITLGDTTEEMGDSIALKAAVEKLPERDRKIIEFRYFSGMTQTVAAKQLGMTQVQVSRREKVILQELRKRLSG